MRALENKGSKVELKGVVGSSLALVAAGILERESENKLAGSGALNHHVFVLEDKDCLLYTSPSPRDLSTSRMPSSA